MSEIRKVTAITSFVFFLSGASALAFETVWFRITSTILGNSIWSAAAVLMAFMLGLGLGNFFMAFYGHKIKKPFFIYIIVEFIIGISGVVIVLMLPVVSPYLANLFQNVLNSGGIKVFRFTFAFSIFLIPAVAMGVTLPVLQKGLFYFDQSFIRSLGRLYGWNTIGAVFGVLFTEFVLISCVGIQSTAFVACLCNFSAAIILMQCFRDQTLIVNNQEPTSKVKVREKLLFLLAPFLTGLNLLALEVIWFRYLLLIHNGTSHVFAVMLTIVLVGIGCGGLIITLIKPTVKKIQFLLSLLSLLAAIAVIISFYLFYLILKFDFIGVFTNFHVFVFAACILMLPTSIISGAIFPLFGERLFQEMSKSTTKASGILVLANTVGAAIGTAIATFLLLPYVGVENAIFILALSYVLANLLINIEIKARIGLIIPVLLAIVIVLVFPFGTLKNSYQIFSQNLLPHAKLVRVKEGLYETLQYYQQESFGQPHTFTLVTNNYSMSGTTFLSKRYMKFFVYFPYLLKNNIQDVLQISYGVGMTAEAVVSLKSVKHFDVVDVSKDILVNSDIIHQTTKVFPLKDKRTKVHIEDGRFFLQTTKQKYDLITGEPPPPKMAGIVNLYTEEYFQLMKSKLKPEGMVTYWLPAHDLHDFDSLAIIKAFCQVFPRCSLWNGGGLEFMLVGVKGKISAISQTEFQVRWDSPLATELHRIGFEKPGQFLATFMADSEELNKLTINVEPLVDNFPQRILPSYKNVRNFSKLYHYLLDVSLREKRLKQSQFINRHFPKAMVHSSLKYFRAENILTVMALPQQWKVPFSYWQELVYVLQKTDLHTLPMVMLQTLPSEMDLYRQAKQTNSQRYLQLAIIEQVINRNYSAAEKLIEQLLTKFQLQNNRDYYSKLFLVCKGLQKTLKITDIEHSRKTDLQHYQGFLNWLMVEFKIKNK